MPHLSRIITESFAHIRKHFIAIFFTVFISACFSLAPSHFLKGQSLFLILFIICQLIVQSWVFIAIFGILSGETYSVTRHINFFSDRFSKWFFGSVAAFLVMARSFFPFIFPFIYKAMQFLFVSPTLLFQTDDKENALEKSKAMASGKEWSLLAIMVACALPAIIAETALPKYFEAELSLLLKILITALVSTFSNVFIITFYKNFSPVTPIQPEAQNVNYSQLAGKFFLKGFGGFMWMMFVIFAITFTLIFLVKKGT